MDAPRLGDEPFRRGLGSGAKITMPAAGNTHEVLGRLDHCIKALAERNRNDGILVAVHHQHRRRNLASARIRTELLSLELDEAMANRRDRGDTFMSFLRDYLFDTTISDAEYVDQLHVRRAALAAAADHLLAVLDREEQR